MKRLQAFALMALALTAQTANASDATKQAIESQVQELCGSGSINEMVRAKPGDVTWTENGFHVQTLNETIGFGDKRLIFTDARSTYLCTEGSASEEEVRWLFIPRKSLI